MSYQIGIKIGNKILDINFAPIYNAVANFREKTDFPIIASIKPYSDFKVLLKDKEKFLDEIKSLRSNFPGLVSLFEKEIVENKKYSIIFIGD